MIALKLRALPKSTAYHCPEVCTAPVSHRVPASLSIAMRASPVPLTSLFADTFQPARGRIAEEASTVHATGRLFSYDRILPVTIPAGSSTDVLMARRCP